ncbi:N-acetylmuramoyl-L-alanine amidase family protein [Rubritalea squalenifaciens]|nr:N-acetylmuramoyl-L-alanine amidase [Rubritalea squalenifaciens]
MVSCTPTGNWEAGTMETTVTSPTGGVSLSQSYWGHRPGPRGFKTVIIDAGHGGHDSGAVGRRVREKDVALDTARRLQRKLQGDFKVVMVRDSDRFIDLNKRVSIANRYKSAVLVSIHYNHSGRSSRGPETYYWRVDSYGLAKRLQREMARVSPSERGSRGQVRRRLRLTRNTKIPSVLVEIGYLSNYSDARLSRSSSYRDKMAEAMARAIRRQALVGDAGLGPLPKPINAPISRPMDPPGS